MFWPKDILQNLLMALPPVRKLAMRRHCTGMKGDPKLVRQAYEALVTASPVHGRRILELGPGQTLDLLTTARNAGAAACAAVDVLPYVDPMRAAEMEIDYRIYDGRRLPFDDASFDVVWAWDVLEHLRQPLEVLREVRRVLAPGGAMVCRVDLRDHYHLADEQHWLNCLAYPLCVWNAMTWYRSAYVNRLRLSQWQGVFREAGFTRCDLHTSTSEKLSVLREHKFYLRHYSDEDVTTWQFTAVCSA
jgi:ubiquinone/menaquinone biosynthesis C-methylase UbiE